MVSTSLTFPVPLVPGCAMPGLVILDHPKVEPVVALVATYTNVDPVQTGGGDNVLLSIGVGLMGTTTFWGVPLNPPTEVV